MMLRVPRLLRQRSEDRVRIADLGAALGPVYAVGDVHGCSALLRAALRGIRHDAAALGGEATVILLGDMIDRGPDSAGVLDLVCAGGGGLLGVLGNHERMMLSFMADPPASRDWLGLGGFETLRSYGLTLSPQDSHGARRMGQMLAAHIPDAHLALLGGLPHGYRLNVGGRDYVFTHAGLDATRPLSAQREASVLWGRNGAGGYPGLCVVQGHVVVGAPQVSDHLIRIDTGACTSGRLSVLRLGAGLGPAVLTITAAGAAEIAQAPTARGRIDRGSH
ncbi:MAG: hypothetical protein RIR62_2306 [Pseudomonadota bacterium]|jgi:serine/threonine protein phosphatase 1